MRSNALTLACVFCVFPTLLSLWFACDARDPVDYDFAFVVWLWFGLPGAVLAGFLFWLGRPDRTPKSSA
jgi:hypothetical protein